MVKTGWRVLGWWLMLTVLVLYLSPFTRHWSVNAAVSKGKQQQLEAGIANQGGGTATSSNFRQQSSIGDATANQRISSPNFRIIPGLLGISASSAPSVTTVTTDLDLGGVSAKTGFLGSSIAPQTWQRDVDPLFVWDPPPPGPNVVGYSYAIDAPPDNVSDTTSISFDVASSSVKALSDGKHVFSVKAIDATGRAGNVSQFEIWIDTTPPQVGNYDPAPGSLLNLSTLQVHATVSDAGSGVTATSVRVLINSASVSFTVDPATGALVTTGGAWKEGINSIEVHAADAVGNAQTPLVWSVTIDTVAPTGTISIDSGAQLTRSVYVTLGLTASDATSGVTRMLLSNDATSGFVEEPYVVLRELWPLRPVRGMQTVYAKFVDGAGNVSAVVSDQIELALFAPDTIITSGPAGYTPSRVVTFTFMCPNAGCVFSYAIDNDPWSSWSASGSMTTPELSLGNHYFRVKAAKDVNGIDDIQPDEEDPSPAERTWIVGIEPPILAVPKGPPIKIWRLE